MEGERECILLLGSSPLLHHLSLDFGGWACALSFMTVCLTKVPDSTLPYQPFPMRLKEHQPKIQRSLVQPPYFCDRDYDATSGF